MKLKKSDQIAYTFTNAAGDTATFTYAIEKIERAKGGFLNDLLDTLDDEEFGTIIKTERKLIVSE